MQFQNQETSQESNSEQLLEIAGKSGAIQLEHADISRAEYATPIKLNEYLKCLSTEFDNYSLRLALKAQGKYVLCSRPWIHKDQASRIKHIGNGTLPIAIKEQWKFGCRALVFGPRGFEVRAIKIELKVLNNAMLQPELGNEAIIKIMTGGSLSAEQAFKVAISRLDLGSELEDTKEIRFWKTNKWHNGKILERTEPAEIASSLEYSIKNLIRNQG